jgi:hypothetical protein
MRLQEECNFVLGLQGVLTVESHLSMIGHMQYPGLHLALLSNHFHR